MSLRLDWGPHRLGPGKVALLEAIAEAGSIRAAAQALGLSYPKASRLVRELNAALAAPLVSTRAGGAERGGAEVTALGRSAVGAYRAAEAAAHAAASAALDGGPGDTQIEA